MKLEILSLPVPSTGETLGDDAVSEAVGPARIESFESHVVHASGGPRLVLVLGLAEAEKAPRRRPPEADLSGDDRHVFDELRAWRNAYAQARGMAPYLVLPNRVLAGVAAARPREVGALLDIPGIGPAKAELYGPELLVQLEVVEQAVARSHGALDAANDHGGSDESATA